MVSNILQQYIELKVSTIALLESAKEDRFIEKITISFSNVIDSPRTEKSIKTPAQLIRILEKRDCLSHTNISPIRDIIQLLNHLPLLNKVEKYEDIICNGSCIKEISYFDDVENSEKYSNYSTTSSPSYCRSSSNSSYTTLRPTSDFSFQAKSPNTLPTFTENNEQSNQVRNISLRKKEEIYDTVYEEIGSSWKELARNLSLRESKIDEINMIYPSDLKSRVVEILNFNEKKNPSYWLPILCDALFKSRRNDIKEKIEKIHFG